MLWDNQQYTKSDFSMMISFIMGKKPPKPTLRYVKK